MKYPITQLDFDRDFAGFVELSRAIYGEKAVADEALYRWLFEKNIYNPKGYYLFHVAKDGDKVVASDCLMPVPLSIKGNKYLAAWSIKTMTHPDYQRQGIFRAMTEFNITRARELGIDIILGFANANSFPGYKKFGWEVLWERRAIIRPLDIRQSLRRKAPLSPFAEVGNKLFRMLDKGRLARLAAQAQKYETEIHSSAPETCDKLWAKMQAGFAIAIERDQKYIEWRYNQRPNQEYKFVVACAQKQPEAMLVFRRHLGNNSCIIIDYIGAPESPAIPALLHETVQYCLDNNLRYIINSSGSRFDDYLCNHFWFKYLTAPLANNMFIAHRINRDINPAHLTEQENWFISYGDSELDLDLQFR